MTDRRNVWTDEAIAGLRRLWDEGLSARTIGEAIGFGKNSVISKSHRLHLPSRPPPLNGAKPRTRRTPEQVATRAAPKPAPVVVVADVPLPPPPVPSVRACQYPQGHPKELGFRYCGEPVWRGVYCRACFARCYQRLPVAA